MKIFLFILCISTSFASISFERNPGCDLNECQNSSLPSIFYAKRIFNNRTVHIVFSSFDQLTINIFEMKIDSSPLFNYPALFERNYSNAISFNDSTPLNSFAIILRRLIQFNDSNDNGKFDKNDPTIVTYDLTNIASANSTKENPVFQFEIPSINGTLAVDVLFPGEKMRDKQFPKLQISDEGFYLDIVFQANQYTNTKTRFGCEFYLMSYDKEGLSISSSRFIDDHYTPGIFNVWQLKRNDNLYKGSMLWKPVVYLDDSRSIEQNTLMQIYPLINSIALKDTDQGIYRSFYKSPASYVSSFNVSWGQANDGFFAKSNYTFVQFTAALNDLETDSTQMFVTVALIISLALPALVAVIALILFLKRRFSSSSPTFSNYDTLRD